MPAFADMTNITSNRNRLKRAGLQSIRINFWLAAGKG